MKKIYLTIIGLAVISLLYAQKEYYWSMGRKNYLEPQSNVFVIKLKQGRDFNKIKERITSDNRIRDMIKLKPDLGILFTKDSMINEEALKENSEFSNIIPAYILSSSYFFPTGEILIKPKDNIPIDEILKLTNYEVNIKEKQKYNRYILEPYDWNKLFEFSNLFYESGLVEYSHPNFIAQIERSQIDDPYYVDQYYLNNTGQFGGQAGIDINAPEAWGITTGICPIRVALIDDGVENHDDINGRVLEGYTPCYSEENPDTQGAPNDNDPTNRPFGHGECCVGIIGASHNSIGIRGIAPNVNIIPINIFNNWYESDGVVIFVEDAEDYTDAIDWAWDEGEADVISNSWNYYDWNAYFDVIAQAIGRARTDGRNGKGCVVVFSSGNEEYPYNHLDVKFPANVEGVITVGAIDKSGNIWDYSCRGASMDLVAPSGNINLQGDVRTTDREDSKGYSTGDYFVSFGGTSAACPQAAGVAALMLSINSALTESQIRAYLQQTATDMGTSGFDNTYGYGRLNAYAALQEVYPYMSGPEVVCSTGNQFTIDNYPSGSTIKWSWDDDFLSCSNSESNPTTFYSTESGQAWVSAKVYLSCGDSIVMSEKTVWSGKPIFNSISGPNPPYIYKGCTGEEYTFWANPARDPDSQSSYTWMVQPGYLDWYFRYQYYDWVTIVFNDPCNYYQVIARATNTCGPTNWVTTYDEIGFIEIMDCYYFSMYPNPASDYVTITLTVPDSDKDFEIPSDFRVQIIDNAGITYYSANKSGDSFTIPVNNLKDGNYLVRITFGKKIENLPLIIKR